MTCHDLLAYLSCYLDGELDTDLAVAAHDHLATYHNCRVVVHTTQNIIQLGHPQRQHVIAQIQQALTRNLAAPHATSSPWPDSP